MEFLKKALNTRRRRVLFTFGALVSLAGASLIAVGLYSIAFNGDDGRDDEAAVVDLADAPIDLDIAPDVPPAVEPTPATPPLGDSGYQLVIDKLGVNAPVSTFGLDEQRVPEVPYTATDVAWYDFSARPGTGSNAVFAGHVTWSGRAVFYDLDQIQAGDQVRLQGQDGTTLTYNVSSVFQVDPNDPDSLKVMWPTDQDVITIITCSGKFFETNDPVAGGDYTKRLVVRADLVSVNRPAAAGG